MIQALLPVLLVLAAPTPRPVDPAVIEAPPALVVVVVFDQLRGDYMTRFRARYLPPTDAEGRPGGFRYLMERGAWFANAEFEVFQAMTCPGHAVVATGASGARNGVPLNHWFDPARDRRVYCMEDPAHALVGPLKEPVERPGTSPRNLLGSTLSDAMKNAGLGTRSFSVALKDRAAILLGGHRADLALWMDRAGVQWISSDYYLKALPPWVVTLNAGLKERAAETWTWNVGPGTGRSDAPFTAFPREVKRGEKPALATPLGLDYTLDAVEAGARALKLGQRGATDYLGVSFSSFDALGHEEGPNSVAMEEMAVAADARLARLLRWIEGHVPGGLDRVVVAVTGDHGVGPSPIWAAERKLPAWYVDQDELGEALDAHLRTAIGAPPGRAWVLHVRDFNVWFAPLPAKRRAEAIDAARAWLRAKEWVWTTVDARLDRRPPGLLGRQVAAQYFDGRSGDLVIVTRPYTIKKGDVANHMTGYVYDRRVPILLAGPHIRPAVFAHEVKVRDLAPTLAFLAGVLPPATAEGRVLHEALKPAID